uniref:Uncharacterized protein n=1 Tax=Pseudopediastrum boryanum TaxID=55410 RepID=A0A2U8GJ08_PSEBY|nr:hypothetical protein [Pseudopediastrum boryanum]AWI68644.1 hypothetical protein [Pseudopediastrum boryanum]
MTTFIIDKKIFCIFLFLSCFTFLLFFAFSFKILFILIQNKYCFFSFFFFSKFFHSFFCCVNLRLATSIDNRSSLSIKDVFALLLRFFASLRERRRSMKEQSSNYLIYFCSLLHFFARGAKRRKRARKSFASRSCLRSVS